MRHLPQSPYTRALGERRWQLQPVLREYFAPLPEGHVGIGEGTFAAIECRRAWLRRFLSPLQRRGVLFAGWEEDVAFRVVNRTVAGRAIGEREVFVGGGSWTMHDAVALSLHGSLVDEVGEPSTIAVRLEPEVSDGALTLTSQAVGLRFLGLRIRIPRFLSPRLRLRESFDPDAGRQHVEVTVDVPFLGRVNEYRGDFVYRVEPETP